MAIDALPKAELHLHLEGSIRPDTALKLAARHGVTLTPEEVAARYNFSNFSGFLDMFKWVTSFLRTPDDYALITRQLCEELVRQNVVYAEFTISAGVILRRMQNLEATVAAIREEIEEFAEVSIEEHHAIVCLVGENIRKIAGTTSRVFAARFPRIPFSPPWKLASILWLARRRI